MSEHSTLHTLAARPGSQAFDDCLRLLRPGDALLLLGDGVYALLKAGEGAAALAAVPADVYVLEPDALLAGVPLAGAAASPVDMDGFVTLTERHARQLAWY